VGFLPSSITLREDGVYSTAAELASLKFLQAAFGKNIAGVQIDWNGDGAITTGQAWTLDGGQCLVFWLGGIQGTMGFNSNPTNPGFLGGGAFRQPYFSFNPLRLIPGPAPAGATQGFPYYRDAYTPGAPYAYFTSYPSKGYSTTDCNSAAFLLPIPAPPNTYLVPYQYSPTQFVNANGFQIISAGKDGQFGPGGSFWNPATGYGPPTPTFPPGPYASDDIANFSQAVLAAPQS
jgi:hypothetical protein